MNNVAFDSIAFGIGIGFALGLANLAVAAFAGRVGLRQDSEEQFLKIVFGSMAARLVVSLACVWFGLKAWNLHTVAFPVMFLGTYSVLMSVEVVAVHRRMKSSFVRSSGGVTPETKRPTG